MAEYTIDQFLEKPSWKPDAWSLTRDGNTVCRSCFRARTTNPSTTGCQSKGHIAYWEHFGGNSQSTQRRRLAKWRRLAIEILGGKCVECGISDLRVLQVNHKNGGGTKERRETSSIPFYRSIVDGTRPRDDLDIRCANHNILYEYVSGKRVEVQGV